MNHKHRLIAFLAVLGSIVLLSTFAAITVIFSERPDDKLVSALGFISSAVTGLIGLIGTFRPQQSDKEHGE